jgi:hypothetical protein
MSGEPEYAPPLARVPAFAVLLSVAGLLPLIACAVGAVTINLAVSARMLRWLVEYGAVLLAFVGAVHWGLVLAQPAGSVAPGARARLLFGVTPMLIAWAALLVTPWIGLGVLIGGFAFTVISEMEANRRRFLPPGYMLLRLVLSAVIVVILGIVMLLRLFGTHLS